MSKKNEPWQIAASRFCVENSQGFQLKDLNDFVKLKYSVSDEQLSKFAQEELQFPLGSVYSRTGTKEGWVPPLTLVSAVVNYDSLQEARTSSRQAMRVAIASLILGAFVGVAGIIVQIYLK